MTRAEAAEKVVDKLLGMAKVPRLIAVFVGKDKTSIQMTRPETEVFAKAFAVRRNDFVGIYNDAALTSWIDDDLAYAGFVE